MNGLINKRFGEKEFQKYNYSLTKKNIDNFMEPLYELIYRFRNINPPTIGYKMNEVNIQHTRNTTSQIEKYVIKKIETEEQVLEYYNVINEVIEDLRDDEKIVFKAMYLECLSEEEIAEKMNVSRITIVKIKKSCILKVGLMLNLIVFKEG